MCSFIWMSKFDFTDLHRPKFTEEYWTRFLKANNFEWVISSLAWAKLWGKIPYDAGPRKEHEYPILFENSDGLGFVLLNCPKRDYGIAAEVYAAIVDKNYRRKGVLKNIWREIESQSSFRSFFVDDVTPERIWGKLGFVKDQKRGGGPTHMRLFKDL